MEDQVQQIISFFTISDYNNIELVLSGSNPQGINKKLLKSKIDGLKNSNRIIQIYSNESVLEKDAFIPGPGIDFKEDQELTSFLIMNGYSRSDSTIFWENIIKRYQEEIMEKIEDLEEKITKKLLSPKQLELEYFDISLIYHQFHSYFFEKCITDDFDKIKQELSRLRSFLDNLEY